MGQVVWKSVEKELSIQHSHSGASVASFTLQVGRRATTRLPFGVAMRIIICSVLLGTALLISANPQSPAPSPPSRNPKQVSLELQLRAADLEFCKQTAARRLDGWMDFFADDASILQNGKTVSGKADLRKHYEPMFANKDFTLTWTPVHAEAAKDGSLGYTYGTYEARTGSDVSRGMYLTIWRRVSGKWKVVMDTGSALRNQEQ